MQWALVIVNLKFHREHLAAPSRKERSEPQAHPERTAKKLLRLAPTSPTILQDICG